MKIKLKTSEIQEYVNAPTSDYPKYTTQLMNLANQNSQATRPRNVGQLSELIQLFPGQTLKNGSSGINKGIRMRLMKQQIKSFLWLRILIMQSKKLTVTW